MTPHRAAMECVGMRTRVWLTAALFAVVLALLASLALLQRGAAAQATVSEGQAGKVIAVAVAHANGSLLYLIDTAREVVLVYGFSSPGAATAREVRNGAFEFLAGRLYRWDLLLAEKREYSIKGVNTLKGLRVHGNGSSEEEYKRAGE